MIVDLRRTLIHKRPSPVARDDVFAAELVTKFGGEWDVWADHETPGLVQIYIAGPGGIATVFGSWRDALDVNGWELRQMNAARQVCRPCNALPNVSRVRESCLSHTMG